MGTEKYIILFPFSHKDELHVVQEEEKRQAIEQYDLDLRPKLRKFDRMKSLSMSSILTVKPVDSAGSSKAIEVKAFDSPKVPDKKKHDKQIITAKRMDGFAISNRLQKLDVKSIGRKKVRRQKLFPFHGSNN